MNRFKNRKVAFFSMSATLVQLNNTLTWSLTACLCSLLCWGHRSDLVHILRVCSDITPQICFNIARFSSADPVARVLSTDPLLLLLLLLLPLLDTPSPALASCGGIGVSGGVQCINVWMWNFKLFNLLSRCLKKTMMVSWVLFCVSPFDNVECASNYHQNHKTPHSYCWSL